MTDKKNQQLILSENLVASKIYLIRNRKVMLDRDLAELYEVETKVLNQAVCRNIERFPDAFMFQLTLSEFEILKSQIVTSSWGCSLPHKGSLTCIKDSVKLDKMANFKLYFT